MSALKELLRQFFQGDRLPLKPPGQRHPPLQGAVGHGDLTGPLPFQVLQGQFRHLPGPQQQDVFAGQVPEDFLGHGDCGIADADGVVADTGLAPHPFGHGKGLVDQAVENGAGGVVRRGLPVRLLHLPQDLGFPHHHGIQAGRHPEEMLHRLPVPVDVEGLVQVARGNLRVAGKKLPDPGRRLVRRLGDAHHLHPVAGGVQQALGDFGPAFQVVIGVRPRPG